LEGRILIFLDYRGSIISASEGIVI
jgi:hypothetical protein